MTREPVTSRPPAGRTCGLMCELNTLYVPAERFDQVERANAALLTRIEALERALAAESARLDWMAEHSMGWRIRPDAQGKWFAMDCTDGLVISAEDAPSARALIDQLLTLAAGEPAPQPLRTPPRTPMSSVANYVLAHCIPEAASFLVASQSLDGAVAPASPRGFAQRRLRPGFTPSSALQEAVLRFYLAFERHMAALATAYPRGEGFIVDELAPWAQAYIAEDRFKPFGWAHRILDEMVKLRQRHGHHSLGDDELSLLKQIVRQGLSSPEDVLLWHCGSWCFREQANALETMGEPCQVLYHGSPEWLDFDPPSHARLQPGSTTPYRERASA